MDQAQLKLLFGGLQDKRVLVLGDFFLDKYLIIDPARDEPSLETGLTAYQVVNVRVSPGAAGTVANNLSALGVGQIVALGAIGDDGEGYELRRELDRRGICTQHLVVDESIHTPTYTKPMRQEASGLRELNRLDIKNFEKIPQQIENAISMRLSRLASQVDGIVVMDQVAEAGCGVVTERIRTQLAQLGRERPHLPIIADSRARIGLFQNVMVKPNAREALASAGLPVTEAPSLSEALAAAKVLGERTNRPVFITLGPRGQMVHTQQETTLVPTINVPGPIDIVGAGDSTTAGIICALVSGWSPTQAALLGNIVASITIQQLGTTGTASPQQVLQRAQDFAQVQPTRL